MSNEVFQEEALIRDRSSARYALAKMLLDERFEEATGRAREWHKRCVIVAEDVTFVEEIVKAASEVS